MDTEFMDFPNLERSKARSRKRLSALRSGSAVWLLGLCMGTFATSGAIAADDGDEVLKDVVTITGSRLIRRDPVTTTMSRVSSSD